MALQDIVGIIALVGIGLVTLGFIFVIIQAGKPADDAATRQAARTAHRLQAGLFAVLFVGFVAGSWATLHHFPIPPQHSVLDAKQVVDVVGRQWSWKITPSTVQTGSTVEFRVTSADVNHGFALYTPAGRIVTETQAMPGYTNKLLYTFPEPGTYTVQCLEYCGLGHAPMHAEFNVVAAGVAAANMVSTNGPPTKGPTAAPAETGAAASQLRASGKQIFTANCAVCHQATGQGVPGVFPPLKGNSVVNDSDPDKQIHVVLHGLQGEVISGVKYPAAMTPFAGSLSNEEIAAVIDYERSSWGNHGKMITPAQVAAVRSAGQ